MTVRIPVKVASNSYLISFNACGLIIRIAAPYLQHLTYCDAYCFCI